MAQLLCNCGYAKHNRRLERMASPQNTHVYLETMEKTKDKSCQSWKVGYATLESLQKRQFSERLLGCCGERNPYAHHHKQKTCTSRIFWYIPKVQVSALFMIEPPCTERYARWCERSAAQLMGSLLLDFSGSTLVQFWFFFAETVVFRGNFCH